MATELAIKMAAAEAAARNRPCTRCGQGKRLAALGLTLCASCWQD